MINFRKVFFFTLFVCWQNVGLAQQNMPGKSTDWLNRVSNDNPGPHKHIRPMHLSYVLSVKGRLNAGKMEVLVKQPQPGVYKTITNGHSSGLARALFGYDFSGEAKTDANTLKPISFQISDLLKGKNTTFSTQFPPFAIVNDTVVEDIKTGVKTPYRNVMQFKKDVGLDLMSSALYLRSQLLYKGQEISLVASSFNSPYLVDFKVLAREKRMVKGTNYPAIKLSVKISKIHPDMAVEPYSKIEQATVWISDDVYRVPIEFKGDIFIGSIGVLLTSRKWL